MYPYEIHTIGRCISVKELSIVRFQCARVEITEFAILVHIMSGVIPYGRTWKQCIFLGRIITIFGHMSYDNVLIVLCQTTDQL